MKEDRIVVREGEETSKKKKSWFSRRSSKVDPKASRPPTTRPPSGMSANKKPTAPVVEDDELPERMEHSSTPTLASGATSSTTTPVQSPPGTPRASDVGEAGDSTSKIPIHAGFDLKAIKEVIASADADAGVIHAPVAQTPRARLESPLPHEPSGRAESAPPPVPAKEAPPDEYRSMPEAPRPGGYSRSRVTSTPLFAPMGGFGEDADEDEADDGDISSALGSSSTLAGPSGQRRDLSSSFARSVTLGDSPYQSQSTNYASAAGSAADLSGTTSRSGYWGATDRGEPSAGRNEWSTGLGGGFSDPYAPRSRSVADDAPKLSFGGAGGSLWEPSVGGSTSIDASMRSPFGSPPASAALPADILNPFALSTSDFSSGSGQRRSEDTWTPPPLPTKNTKASSSVLNVNSNPWG